MPRRLTYATASAAVVLTLLVGALLARLDRPAGAQPGQGTPSQVVLPLVSFDRAVSPTPTFQPTVTVTPSPVPTPRAERP